MADRLPRPAHLHAPAAANRSLRHSLLVRLEPPTAPPPLCVSLSPAAISHAAPRSLSALDTAVDGHYRLESAALTAVICAAVVVFNLVSAAPQRRAPFPSVRAVCVSLRPLTSALLLSGSCAASAV